MALANRGDLAELRAVRLAGERAYKMAGRSPRDIHLAEVHDCFTIAEILAVEALDLFERGTGGNAVERGLTSLGGKVPVNPSGGLKAKGHPVGATGVARSSRSPPAARRGRAATGRGSARRPRPEHGRLRRQLGGAHPGGGVMFSPARAWRESPQRYRREAAQCSTCSKILYPPRLVCPACGGREFTDVVLPRTGKILTYTVVRVPPAGFTAQTPLPIALVELDNGIR
jgi:hypothetical protein